MTRKPKPEGSTNVLVPFLLNTAVELMNSYLFWFKRYKEQQQYAIDVIKSDRSIERKKELLDSAKEREIFCLSMAKFCKALDEELREK
jgi:hypothetical protein